MSNAEIHRGMSFEDYHRIDAESSSMLRDVLVSPLLYRWRKEHDREDRDTLRLGRTVHTLLLESHRFDVDYAIWTGGQRRGKAWDAFQSAHSPRQTIIKEDQWDDADSIATAVRRHAIARALLAEPGESELVIVWTHERTGLRCKARIDRLSSSLTDLKTCRDPKPSMFATSSARLGYHIQLAHYTAAMIASGLGARPVKIIAAQNVEPYDVVVYQVPEEVILVGEVVAQTALDRIAACKAGGEWPGLSADEEVTLHLPSWASNLSDDIGWEVTTDEENTDAPL